MPEQSIRTKTVINIDSAHLPVVQSVELVDVEKEVLINGQKVLRKAKVTDPVLAQFDEDLAQNNQLIRQMKTPNVGFYAYTAKKNDTIAKLAARFCVIADSFVIISGIPSQDEDLAGKLIIVPTAKGLFIPDPEKRTGKESSLEVLLQKNRAGLLDSPENLWYNIDGRQFVFIPDDMFSPTERTFFLDPAMIVPVKDFRISSDYGNRRDPLSGGGRQFHRGVDMAVPNGTTVVACKNGRISDSGQNEVYGKWILIEHSGGISSFYAHLSSIEKKIEKGALVRSGETIGRSGSTGQVTGPHLHFEVRKNGNAVDPKKYIN